MEEKAVDRNKVAVVWLLGILVLWELLAFLLKYVIKDGMAAAKLPYPHAVAATLVQNFGMLLEAGAVTFSRAATGFAIGAAVGIMLAVVMSLSGTMERIAFPYLIVSQMIPVLGLAPIIFNIVRDMNASRIIIAAYITFFPVSVNMLSGLKSVEQDKKDLLFSIAAGKYDVYYKLMFPFSMKYLFNGLKIAAPMAVTASILVDMLGSKSGIGVKILYSLYSNQTDIFWASVVTSAFMGIISFYFVAFAERRLLPWENNSGGKEGVAA
ncbi:MAG: ABC transporter permease [Clostridiales bacterium]|nr:ABC transporter permease [Clostridiales bacterium]